MHKVGRGGGKSPHRSDPYASSSGMEDDKSSYGRREGRRRKVCCYRSQLEQEVQILQKQLQDEFNLHVALANALAKTTAPLLNSIHNIPDEIQELLHSIATLEITVSNLEEELVTLHLQICTERAERHIAEAHLGSPPLTPGPPSPFSDCVPETLRSRNASDEGTEMGASVQLSDEVELKNNFPIEDISNHPNKLSEEMVRCMRNIFLCLSGSSDILPEMSSLEGFQSSPIEHLSSSSFMSFSDSITMTSVFQSPEGIYQMNEVDNQMSSFDPCGVSYKMNWGNVGSYNLAAEVSWMSVGKAQLQYAAEALKRYRFFVEQLTEVNPACMSLNQKLAFWINVYNALMMHVSLELICSCSIGTC
ncbi:hypothetical protein BHE74_00040286 [Ensete ventricosum]|nr:hypothetical protein GW17_00054017 [Ensete ventricosum]RWW53245.1 hypothetical protein BHE74_00040286 [Ensete ventricosum]